MESRVRTTRPIRHVFAAALLPLLLAGCFDQDCPLGISPGLSIEVRDADTGQPASAGVRGLIYRYRETTVLDTLRPFLAPQESNGIPLNGNVGPGTYRVVIERTGYRPWIRDNVVVRSAGGDCGGTLTTRLVADLELAGLNRD